MRNILKLSALALAGTLFLATSANAQEDVPTPGMENACVTYIGYLGCDANGMPRAPQAMVRVYWAAIAVSPTTMAVGAAHGRNSESEADDTALHNCTSSGARDCKVVTDGANQCLAIATSSDKGDGFGPALNRVAAATKALSLCQQAGGKSCVLVAAPCSADDVRWSAPLPLPIGVNGGKVDPVLVGTWIMNRNPGQWVWRVADNGTYEFHSEAMDNFSSNNGTLTAGSGHYTLHAISMTWDDVGTYTVQSRNQVVATGKLGTGTWIRAN